MDAHFYEKQYPGMESVLQERVLARMKELNLKASPLAKKAGLGDSFVRDILRGKTSVPKADNLDRLARALDTTPEYLLGSDGAPMEGPIAIPAGRVPYAGKVNAGAFLEVDEYFNQDDGDHLVPEYVPRHPAYPQLPQRAWHIGGDSMNEAGMTDGMWAIAAPYADYVDLIGELDNGSFVVVERLRHGGSQREVTVKEVQFARKGMRLIPRSTNKKHPEFFIPLDEEADNDTEQVRILDVVLWAVHDVSPRSRR